MVTLRRAAVLMPAVFLLGLLSIAPDLYRVYGVDHWSNLHYHVIRVLWAGATGWLYSGPLFFVDRVMSARPATWRTFLFGLRRFMPLGICNAASLVPSALDAWAMERYPHLLHHAGGLLVAGASVAAPLALVPLLLVRMDVVHRDASLKNAIYASVTTAKGRFWALGIAWAAFSVAASAGVLACGIGLIATAPIMTVGEALIYRELRGLRTEVAG